MKIWIRLVLGVALGVLLSFSFPAGQEHIMVLFSTASSFIIHMGRYVVFPLVFFSLAIGTFRLRQEKRILSIYARTGIYLILSSAVLVLLGSFSVMLLSPERIPIIIEKDTLYRIPSFSDVFLDAFPKNIFNVFTGSGDFILPVFLLAVFLGLAFASDRRVSEPVILLCDSLSRVFYNLNKFVTEILAFGLVVLSAYLLLQMRSVVELDLFKQLFLIIGVDTAIVIFLLYPLIIFLMGERKNPYRWLYGIIAPAITAFVSGDGYFSLGMLIRSGRENLGIPRKVASTTFPLFLILGHAGTAMVASTAFIVILRSYSSLEITLVQVILATMYSFAVSFILGPVPGKGVMVALFLLSSFHGRGIEDGYLILKPVAPLLISAGVLLDVVTSAFISALVARREDVDSEVEVKQYI